MEFLIPKVKRCGKFILRPHRREAVRIVCFALLSFLIPIGLATNLFYLPHTVSLSLFGKTFLFSPTFLCAGVAAMFLIFFNLPLFFGIKRWYLLLCRPEQMRKPSVLYFFSSFRLYIKAVLTGLLLTVQGLILYLVGIAPAFSSALVSVIFFRRSSSDLGVSLSLLCLAAAVGLFFCGVQAARCAGKRYFWIPWLLANDPSLSLGQIFSESVRLTQKNRETLNKIRRSLWGRRIFSLGLFPALWTVPLLECTLAVWLSEKLPSAGADPSRAPFRQRKTKRSPPAKTILTLSCLLFAFIVVI